MRLTHGRLALELHEVTRGDGPSLLLLHALYSSSAQWSEAPIAWPGSVYALDFCGHGRSDWVGGGAYYSELLVADADVALAHIGRAVVVGAGLGAYVALLLAGGRPDLVPAALLLPGAGLAGGGPLPDFAGRRLPMDQPTRDEPAGTHDPLVRVLDRDVRPPDYVEPFARAAHRLLLEEDGSTRPPWWEAVRAAPAAELAPPELSLALARLAAEIRR
ncbi:MAG TPA: alpha/beta fold hydrolase [Candidatus Kryptonia bacterium]|nr:alpha/beta fold hydrolase [Candidatus Kryptonia bacterium]